MYKNPLVIFLVSWARSYESHQSIHGISHLKVPCNTEIFEYHSKEVPLVAAVRPHTVCERTPSEFLEIQIILLDLKDRPQ